MGLKNKKEFIERGFEVVKEHEFITILKIPANISDDLFWTEYCVLNNKTPHPPIGRIFHYSIWRKMVFEPSDSFVLDATCLEAITDCLKDSAIKKRK